ncbi:MAG: Asp-tRNA(Asn)/Glu-tRNA(Gln) amidotransferase subunit GatC [Deltaproteobacteria bacterium]|nr:Asp-tRNA(Asn)/Glu-tRNA(Gln) amidotransferase subunit GatC [Deltaproteobacteria bacterium]
MITRETVEKIAKLARLQLSESDLEKYTGQLNNILADVEKLKELNTDAIEATTHAVEVANPLREDEVKTNTVIDAVLEISPDHEAHFFRVPKVL